MRIKILVYLSLEILDILSGIVSALIKGQKLSSAKMRVGLFKKMGNIICLATSFVLSKYMYEIIMISLFDIVWLYTVAMTTVSIFENVGQPKMVGKVKEVFKDDI